MLRNGYFSPPHPLPLLPRCGGEGEKLFICTFWVAEPPKMYRWFRFPALGAGLGVTAIKLSHASCGVGIL